MGGGRAGERGVEACGSGGQVEAGGARGGGGSAARSSTHLPGQQQHQAVGGVHLQVLAQLLHACTWAACMGVGLGRRKRNAPCSGGGGAGRERTLGPNHVLLAALVLVRVEQRVQLGHILAARLRGEARQRGWRRRRRRERRRRRSKAVPAPGGPQAHPGGRHPARSPPPLHVQPVERAQQALQLHAVPETQRGRQARG